MPPLPDEIALLIESKRYRYWSEMDITLSLDAYATCDIVAPFDADREEFRASFQPFSYADLDVQRGGKPLFSGTLVGIEPEILPNKESVRASAYSRPGVLADCTLPAGAKREFRKMTLRDIATAVAEPFGLSVDFRGDPGAPFNKEKINPSQTVHDFLEGLAQQRNMLLSSTVTGDLLIWRAAAGGSPRVRLKAGERPLAQVRPIFDVQRYHSEITGHSGARRKKGSTHTEHNPWLTSKVRPSAENFDDVEKGDLPEATRAAFGRMFGNAVSWNVTLPTWTDPDGELWEPNTTITLEAPKAMIYRETELLVRRAMLRSDREIKSAQLEVSLLGAFTGEFPRSLPWVA